MHPAKQLTKLDMKLWLRTQKKENIVKIQGGQTDRNQNR